MTLKLLFWISAALLAYAYAGYPLWLWLRMHWALRPVKQAPILPTVSVIMAVHNEAGALPAKLTNLTTLNYPPECYEVIVVSDGSTDTTNQILASYTNDKLRTVNCAEHRGKAAALNAAIAVAQGEIVVFTDARQSVECDAIRKLVRNFADPGVGCVSGNLNLGEPGTSTGKGLGLYWRIEKSIRQAEAATGSMVGTTGALYATRRNLLTAIPEGTLLDDVYIPMNVVRQGKRAVFETEAIAWDELDKQSTREFQRKIRTLVGNYQLVRLAPWLITKRNPILFEFVSHKVLRLFGPLMLLGMFLSSLLLPGSFYKSAMVLQAVFYLTALVALMRSRPALLGRVSDAAFTFVMLNTAALVALLYFVTGKKEVWTR